MLRHCWILTLVYLGLQFVHVFADEFFDENLYIRSLNDGKVYTHFQFKTLLEDAVPRLPNSLSQKDEPLGQILREYAVTELHLSLNAGKWDYRTWGYPNGSSVGNGAELWVWMGEDETHKFDARWQGVRNALAGLFCASLGELNERRTTSPTYAFQPTGDIPSGNESKILNAVTSLSTSLDVPHRLAYASHPSEHICTENLTPFIKLLPCKAYSGIAALLNPHRLFDADWHGMSIQALWNAEKGIEIELSVQAVFDPVRLHGRKDRSWSFSHLFGKNIQGQCSVARDSRIEVDLPSSPFTLTPPPITNEVAQYNVNTIQEPLDVVLKYSDETSFVYPTEIKSSIPLSIERSHSGTSQAKGRMHVTIKNMQNFSQLVTYLETPPWIIKFYLHTLTIRVNDEEELRNDILQFINYIPTESNKPTLFESILLLPPQSTVHMTIDFDKTFLRYTEHPPDAQRGWDLPSALLIPLPSNVSNQVLPRMYTKTLLIDLATPDFSMPYNVITMTGALMAMLFGNIFNLLTREFVAVSLDK
ncbi:hypothetical protein Clacol_003041 [Clathrus columnatus]|uniref:GPI transamidase component PIG-T n=1 Tax=Clathrus columnatus TaxID=1419009 RepID=A0AAV5A2G1_9AGAM|nr:hypothetical protein Clacol_003041 [Clathrus columnatus]